MKSGDSRLRDKEKEESFLRKECGELKEKANQISVKHDETLKELNRKEVKI